MWLDSLCTRPLFNDFISFHLAGASPCVNSFLFNWIQGISPFIYPYNIHCIYDCWPYFRLVFMWPLAVNNEDMDIAYTDVCFWGSFDCNWLPLYARCHFGHWWCGVLSKNCDDDYVTRQNAILQDFNWISVLSGGTIGVQCFFSIWRLSHGTSTMVLKWWKSHQMNVYLRFHTNLCWFHIWRLPVFTTDHD